MKTYILIENKNEVSPFPTVYIIRDGKHTGSSTTLTRDTSEKACLEAAENMACGYIEPVIINHFNKSLNAREYFDFLRTLK